MNENMKQQIMFFNRPKIGIEEFDFGVLFNNKMQLREPVQIAELDRYLPWFSAMNTKGADIYIRPHRYNSNAVIFLDDVEREQALAISRKYAACVIETSKEGGCHIWLQTDRPLNERERYLAQRYLQPLVHSDRGSISGEHFGRLAGFKNHKRGGQWVNVIAVSNSPVWCVPSKVLVDDKQQSISRTPLSPKGACVVHGSGGSESENEWGYVCGKLEHGADPIYLERELAERAEVRGKRNAKAYAHRTIQNALSRINHYQQ